MSVVIIGHLCIYHSLFLLFPLGTLLILVIGMSRVYSRARFPHQIIGSWITGALGLYTGLHCCDMFGFHL